MSHSLFRPEVAKRERERLLGAVIISQPVSYLMLTLLISVGVLVSIAFLVANDYERRETVSGFLVPDRGVAAVYPIRPGLLIESNVEEGDVVEAGAVLFKIQTDQRINAGNYLSSEIIDELRGQKVRLNESIGLARRTLASVLEQQDSAINRITLEISSLAALLGTQQRLSELERSSYERGQDLFSRQAIARADMDAVEKSYLDARQTLQNLELSLQNKRFELEAASITRGKQMLDSQRDIAEIENRLSDINRQIASAEVEQYNVLRAPVAGTVSSLLFQVGQKVDASQALLSIVPADSKLEAHLYIPTRASGFVRPGQSVNLRYDAYPYQRFGLHKGRIKRVAEAVLERKDIPLLGLEGPVYKAVVEIEQQQIRAYGARIALRPGILLSADVNLDSRSLLEWLLEPLFSLQGKL